MDMLLHLLSQVVIGYAVVVGVAQVMFGFGYS